MPIASETEYKGRPMIVLKTKEDEKFPFQFGLRKARMIVDSMADIIAFVEKHDKDGGF